MPLHKFLAVKINCSLLINCFQIQLCLYHNIFVVKVVYKEDYFLDRARIPDQITFPRVGSGEFVDIPTRKVKFQVSGKLFLKIHSINIQNTV